MTSVTEKAGAPPARLLPGPRQLEGMIASPAELAEALATEEYLVDPALATVCFLALRLGRPLLLEGEPGGGKTELAKALARLSGGEFLRLQCYDGIDASQAVYEWDYARQLLHLRAAETVGRAPLDDASAARFERSLYSEEYLVRRPLLQAIAAANGEGPTPVLLIDEIDRADDEFEAYLLEILSDFTVTVPELGTFHAARPPIVIVTSNRTRDVHDALKRRCLYHWLEQPDFDREVAIVRLKVPGASAELAAEVAHAAAAMRSLGLFKPPGVAETIDWALAISVLGASHLDERTVERTLGAVIKYREDAERVRASGLSDLVSGALKYGT
jgi:MoxR-like ATPase